MARACRCTLTACMRIPFWRLFALRFSFHPWRDGLSSSFVPFHPPPYSYIAVRYYSVWFVILFYRWLLYTISLPVSVYSVVSALLQRLRGSSATFWAFSRIALFCHRLFRRGSMPACTMLGQGSAQEGSDRELPTTDGGFGFRRMNPSCFTVFSCAFGCSSAGRSLVAPSACPVDLRRVPAVCRLSACLWASGYLPPSCHSLRLATTDREEEGRTLHSALEKARAEPHLPHNCCWHVCRCIGCWLVLERLRIVLSGTTPFCTPRATPRCTALYFTPHTLAAERGVRHSHLPAFGRFRRRAERLPRLYLGSLPACARFAPCGTALRPGGCSACRVLPLPATAQLPRTTFNRAGAAGYSGYGHPGTSCDGYSPTPYRSCLPHATDASPS